MRIFCLTTFIMLLVKSLNMNKKSTIIVMLFIILVITISTILALPKIKESNIKSEIEKANYCEVDSDCVDAGSKCPFGCYT